MILFFDTETTGLPRNWKAPITDTNNWPRLVQIAWTIFDNNGQRMNCKDYIIKPVDFTIPVDSSKIHGITTAIAMQKGADLNHVLNEFNKEVERVEILVAHNMNFDLKIVEAEMFRNKMISNFRLKQLICTMEASTNFCKIPGNYGYKWPKLSELHIKLFGVSFEEAHNAAFDIEATAKCFWKLKEMKIIE